MKTLIFIILLSIFPITKIAAQGAFPFGEVNSKWNIGISGGYAGYNDEFGSVALGINLTIKGFYADFMGMTPQHKNDLRVNEWSDKQCFMMHGGYQIPITRSFRIIPVIGYAHLSAGTTDGKDWNSGSGEIVNKYSYSKTIDGLDYGALAVININLVNMNLGCTKFAIYGGIAFEF